MVFSGYPAEVSCQCKNDRDKDYVTWFHSYSKMNVFVYTFLIP